MLYLGWLALLIGTGLYDMNKKIHCIHLYKGLRTDNGGKMTMCCKSNENLTDINGEEKLFHETNMTNFIHGEKAKEIRTALENGIKHPNCSKCWSEEDSGIKSKRQHDIDNAIKFWGEKYTYDTEISPDIVEFNLGTVCNLKCRICGPWSSSFWNKEYKDLVRSPEYEEEGLTSEEQTKKYKKELAKYAGDWTEESLAWANIDEHLSHLKKIDIFGGEPFLVEKQWKMLQKSVDNGWAHRQRINFNTNGTQYKDEYIEILSHFEGVFLSLSIDGIKEQFEYMRHPAKWDLLLYNIDKFKEASKKYPNIDVNICLTVNIQNVYDLPETILFFKERGMHVYLNYCHWPLHYNVKHIPEHLKEKIYEKYSKVEDEWVKKCCNDVEGLMRSQFSNKEHWDNFIKKIKDADEYRNESFSKTFPAWSSLIGEFDENN